MNQSALNITPPHQPSEAGAVERAAAAEWQEQVLDAMAYLARARETFTTDDLHHHCQWRGIPEPHHPSQWGAVARVALSRGIIRQTGVYVRSMRPEAAGRRIPEWTA
jgi:hypothetical protein